MKISILGDGGWGTALAILLDKKGYSVTLWGAFPEYVAYVHKKRENTRFLPGIRIPKSVIFTSSLRDAIRDEFDLIIFAIPSEYLRDVLEKIKEGPYNRSALYLSVTKGIEVGSLKRISEIIHEELGYIKLAVLSGPTIAHEVVKGIPTTAVIAAPDESVRAKLQKVFMSETLRIYINEDVIGVELGGSLKNVIAIACGISDGLGFGSNTKAALLSRGMAEMARLGQAMGANKNTFYGISGLGDLVTTCISSFSRNRFVGEQIGKGRSLSEIKKHMKMVAEGVPTAKSAYQLSQKYNVDMPITKEVYAVLYKNKSPQKAVRDLMGREKKEE